MPSCGNIHCWYSWFWHLHHSSIAADVAGEASLIAWLLMTILAALIPNFGYLASAYPSAGELRSSEEGFWKAKALASEFRC